MILPQGFQCNVFNFIVDCELTKHHLLFLLFLSGELSLPHIYIFIYILLSE